MKFGLLLINLGTPDDPSPRAVRRYLAEFLADKHVINLPALLRYCLLYGLILPTRPKQSAHAYQQIWTDEGSPLLTFSHQFVKKLQQRLGPEWIVSLGMRYGNPTIEKALLSLKQCERLLILPLYPQYSNAATGSSIEKTLKILSQLHPVPSFSMIRDFYQNPDYINALAHRIKPYLDHEYILFSYHGIPENHLLKNQCKKLCEKNCSASSPSYLSCYRAQCLKTTELLAKQLELPTEKYSSSFQSRLGRTTWIQPYTDQVLIDLAQSGIKNLAICCPSFVVDCLETLEEIGIRAKQQWEELGGEALTLIPALNDDELWTEAVAKMSTQ